MDPLDKLGKSERECANFGLIFEGWWRGSKGVETDTSIKSWQIRPQFGSVCHKFFDKKVSIISFPVSVYVCHT